MRGRTTFARPCSTTRRCSGSLRRSGTCPRSPRATPRPARRSTRWTLMARPRSWRPRRCPHRPLPGAPGSRVASVHVSDGEGRPCFRREGRPRFRRERPPTFPPGNAACVSDGKAIHVSSGKGEVETSGMRQAAVAHARTRARPPSDTPAARLLARAGLTAREIISILIGWVAALVALGRSSHEADQEGALQLLAGKPYGAVSLWLARPGLCRPATL